MLICSSKGKKERDKDFLYIWQLSFAMLIMRNPKKNQP
jgi:hypothetical protein